MIGSMVATSLAVAPAMLLAADAEWIDLDGPMLLAKDREFGVEVRNGVMSGADRRLWARFSLRRPPPIAWARYVPRVA